MNKRFLNCVDKIIEFNKISGKVKDFYSEEDKTNQLMRVVEEADSEFRSTLVNISKNGLTRENKIQVADDVVDIIFTDCFLEMITVGNTVHLEAMIGNETEISLNELTSHVDSPVYSLISLAYRLYNNENLGIDFKKALELVCDNNLTKFPEYDVELMNKTFDLYGESVVCLNHNYVDGRKLMVFKRVSDGKVMKPYGYKPVDLSEVVL